MRAHYALIMSAAMTPLPMVQRSHAELSRLQLSCDRCVSRPSALFFLGTALSDDCASSLSFADLKDGTVCSRRADREGASRDTGNAGLVDLSLVMSPTRLL